MTTRVDDEALLDVLEMSLESGDPKHDIAALAPDLTIPDAYRLQIALKKRMARKGDPHVGYRVSFASRLGMELGRQLNLMTEEEARGPITPVFSSLSGSNLAGEDRVVRRIPGHDLATEAEVVFVFGKPLQGPGVTPAMALAAVSALYPGFDVPQFPKGLMEQLRTSKAPKLPGIHGFLTLHGLAAFCTPRDTTIVVGPHASSPLLDLRNEGLIVSVDGQVRASGCFWETLGGPLNSVVWLVNELAKYGAGIEAGQMVVSGTPLSPPPLGPDDRVVTAEFTRLGGVTVRIEG